MHPRSRIRGREPPPPSPSPSGGRYSRRSPPPLAPSPRHHRRARDPPPLPQRRTPERPPPPPQRRSPERLPPRRLLLDDKPAPPPPPPALLVPTADWRWRADILLEAGRLAAHYLVAQGVLPEHVLHAREDPSPKNANTNTNHSPSPRPEVPAVHAAGYARKRDDEPHPDDDPRWPRRNGGGGGGDWVRDKREEDDRLARARSGWDRRTQSFDGRRRYNDGGAAGGGGGGGGGDWGRDKRADSGGDRLADRGGGDRLADRGGGRRGNAYDEKRRPAMARSYSQNDRRASSDDRRPSVDRRLDRRRRSRSRSRSRSRTRPRNSYGGGRRDSDWRPQNGDLDQGKVLEPRTVASGDCYLDRDDVDHAPSNLKGPRSVVVMKADDSASHEYEEVVVMEADDGASHEDEEGMVSDDHGKDDGASYEYEEVVESEEDDGASHEDEEMESENHGQDFRGVKDDEAAVAGLNDGVEINARHQLSIVDVHPSEPVEEPVHMQSQLSPVKEDTEAGIAHTDVCLIEPVAENSGCSEVRGEIEAPQSELETTLHEEIPQNELETELPEEIPQNELETGAGDPTRDEEELPAWFGIFDLNVTGAHETGEMSEIPGDPPEDHVLDSVPDLDGQMSEQAYYATTETQAQEELADEDDNHQLEEEGKVLLNQDIGTYDSNENDLSSEQMLTDQGANEHGHGDEQLEDEKNLVNNEEEPLKQDADEHMDNNHQLEDEQNLVNNEEEPLKQDAEEHMDNNHQMEDEQMLVINEETPLKQDAEEHVDHNRQMENGQMLLNEGTALQVLANHHANGEQVLPDHATDEHPDVNHQTKNEQMLLHHVTGAHDLDHCDLNGEQMIQNICADKSAADAGQLKDGQLHLGQAADGQAALHSLENGQTIPVIRLEDDDEEQSDTEEFLDPKSDALDADNALLSRGESLSISRPLD